jgi:hypothetical protein
MPVLAVLPMNISYQGFAVLAATQDSETRTIGISRPIATDVVVSRCLPCPLRGSHYFSPSPVKAPLKHRDTNNRACEQATWIAL